MSIACLEVDVTLTCLVKVQCTSTAYLLSYVSYITIVDIVEALLNTQHSRSKSSCAHEPVA